MSNKKHFSNTNSIRLNFFFLGVIFFSVFTFILSGCAQKTWKDHGDSCILISGNPPLKRVINYSDHDLCGRKLSPRIAPNANIRFLKGNG